MLKIISACLLVGALGAPLDESNIQEHIVGGRDTDISEVPYQVALFKNGKMICGGSIVSPTFIVTAAHCLFRVKAETITFRAGATNVTEGGVIVKAKAAYYHSLWSDKHGDYDVGVVELETPLKFSKNISAIKLATEEPPANASVLVSGWGRLSENGKLPTTLQSVKVPVIDKRTCSIWYKLFVKITPRMVCAGVEGKDSCQGDSGGPLVFNGQLVGIVSFGNGCARKDAPGVYTNVANRDITAFIRQYAKI